MSFNKGYELKKFEAHWEKLRIEYAAAGMTKEATAASTSSSAIHSATADSSPA